MSIFEVSVSEELSDRPPTHHDALECAGLEAGPIAEGLECIMNDLEERALLARSIRIPNISIAVMLVSDVTRNRGIPYLSYQYWRTAASTLLPKYPAGLRIVIRCESSSNQLTYSLRGAIPITTSVWLEYWEANVLMIAFVRAILSELVCQSGELRC